jgi:hypothetical protein
MATAASVSPANRSGPWRRVSWKSTTPITTDTQGFTTMSDNYEAAKGPALKALCIKKKEVGPPRISA